MFHDWENFYLIVGPSAAALIGLLFVVVTLTSGEDRRQAAWGQTLFMTPIVFHFGVILVLSGLAGAPALHRPATSIIVALAAVSGFIYSLHNALGMRKDAEQTPPHWSDIWCYAYGPAAI